MGISYVRVQSNEYTRQLKVLLISAAFVGLFNTVFLDLMCGQLCRQLSMSDILHFRLLGVLVALYDMPLKSVLAYDYNIGLM